MTRASERPALFDRLVGAQLKALRRQRGLGRVELGQSLQPPVVEKTVAQYERAERTLSLRRFAQICSRLDVAPHELLDLAQRHVASASSIVLRVADLAHSRAPELEGLRAWAAELAEVLPTGVCQLNQDQLESISARMGLSLPELMHRLAPFTQLTPTR